MSGPQPCWWCVDGRHALCSGWVRADNWGLLPCPCAHDGQDPLPGT